MKTSLCMLLAVMLLLLVVSPTSARTCGKFRHRHGNYWHTHYSCIGDGHRHGRSFWEKHRDKLTTAAGAGTGAVIGGIVGGKKGAAIGAL